ncbi:hypothetical protein C4J81_17085 [Deltaproteobacteria bacterium Smac51]|nr:hypothetical protein C4J81_17085 [Deltaproteobacteria bacterium Smac51]
MTVESPYNKVQYLGDGAASRFPVPFPVANPAHIHLYLWENERQTEMDSGFQVIGAGTASVYVTTAAPIRPGVKLTILRTVPYVQPMDLVNGGRFNAETLEGSDDNLELQIQQIAERVNRAVVAPESLNENEVTYETLLQIRDDAQAAAVDSSASADRSEEAADKALASQNASEESARQGAASAGAASKSASAAAQSASNAAASASSSKASADSASLSASSAAADAARLEVSMEEVKVTFSALEPGLWVATLGALRRANAAVVNGLTSTRTISKIYGSF